MFGPLNVRKDGTFVFANPLGPGKLPLLSLLDLGIFARYIFDNRELTAGKDVAVVSDLVSSQDIISTFTKVTGKPATFVDLPYDDWCDLFDGADLSVSTQHRGQERDTATLTWREDFRGWWNTFRYEVLSRDLDWARSVHPGLHDLEKWMRETGYQGKQSYILKNVEDGRSGVSPNKSRTDML